MRRFALSILSIALLTFSIPTLVNAQAVEQGTIIIDPYYGYPLSGKPVILELFEPIEITNISGIGPAGARVDYLISNRLSLGIDFIYKQTTGDFTKRDSLSNTLYNYVGTVRQTKIHLRVNYHLLASTDVSDLYVGIGSGSNSRKVILNSDDDPNENLTWNEVSYLPFSGRVTFGMRYYFTNNIGINAEIGIGGPLITGGASIKF